jgi:hypothetical protein
VVPHQLGVKGATAVVLVVVGFVWFLSCFAFFTSAKLFALFNFRDEFSTRCERFFPCELA